MADRETWMRFFRNKYLKTIMEREAWTRFFWECYLKDKPENMEWWNWRMMLPRSVHKGRTSDSRFREGMRTLVKIMDREVFIAEQIEKKVKEHFAEEAY